MYLILILILNKVLIFNFFTIQNCLLIWNIFFKKGTLLITQSKLIFVEFLVGLILFNRIETDIFELILILKRRFFVLNRHV